jgi:uncharacterized protein YxeA
MNKKIIFIIIVVILIAGVGFYFWNKKRQEVLKTKDTSLSPKTPQGKGDAVVAGQGKGDVK